MGLGLQNAIGLRTMVKSDQDRIEREFLNELKLRAAALQEKELSERSRLADARLGEDTRQFDVSTTQQGSQFDRRLGEDTRQFDVTTTQRGDQFNRRLGEDTRQFDAALGQRGDQFDRRLTFDRDELAQRGDIAGKELGLRRLAFDAGGPQRIADVDETKARTRKLNFDVQGSGTGDQSAKARQVLDMLDLADQTVDRLETAPGKAGAVGFSFQSLMGLLDKPISGTQASDYRRHIDTLKTRLTLPKLDVMKGLGPMSEKEFTAVGDSVTALSHNMSEEEFDRELAQIKANMVEARRKIALAAGGGASDDKTVSDADIAAIVADKLARGIRTSIEQERERATAAGYRIIR